MAEPFIGEIRMFAGNFAPVGWALCHGQILAISQYETLFSLIGTTYGGDGQLTFALPDLRGRVPVHHGAGYVQGQIGGSESVTLTVEQLPAHSHTAVGSTTADENTLAGNYWSGSSAVIQYVPGASANTTMNAGALAARGGSQPHDNMAPYLALNFIIALEGVYPTQD